MGHAFFGDLRLRPHTQRMLLKKLQHLWSLAYRPGCVVRSADGVGHGVIGIAVGIRPAYGITGIHDLAAIDDHSLFNRSSGSSQLRTNPPRIRTDSGNI